jgi:diaminohydroxyphosphoribosylaminopyrimidine deaminase/5-amino-6-(5-phosphoribosylamino)uracil reductase
VAALVAELGRRRMTNVLIEGGAAVAGSFIDAGLVDEVHAFIAPVLIGGTGALSPVGGAGAKRIADALRCSDVAVERLGDDVYVRVLI